jgi:hypothetical protein
LQPGFFKGPLPVSLRPPKDDAERQKVLFASLSGGADYGDRPDFYLPFDTANSAKTLERAKRMKDFLTRYPHARAQAQAIALELKQPVDELKYLPIKARKDWIAVLTPSGQIAHFLPGDGF